MFELREQRTESVGKVFESLAVESQDGVIPRNTTPLEYLMERSEFVGPQAEEMSALPVQHKPKSRRQLPRGSGLVTYLTLLYAISARWPKLWPRGHMTQVLAR